MKVANVRCPLCASIRACPFATVGERRYLACGVCGLVHLSAGQRLSGDEERRIYEMHENDPADARYRAFLDRLASPLTSRLRAGSYGLDYGCGPGPTLSLMLQERGFEMEVYDPLFAPNPGLLQRTYDFVTCSETAEHFFEPRMEFDRLNRLLQPGGWLGIMTTILPEQREFATWHYARDPTHVSFYRHGTMRWIAAAFGWAALFPQANVVLFQKPAKDPAATMRA